VTELERRAVDRVLLVLADLEDDVRARDLTDEELVAIVRAVLNATPETV